MGTHYRHTTPEMAARVAAAIQQRLMLVLQIAENHPNRSAFGCSNQARGWGSILTAEHWPEPVHKQCHNQRGWQGDQQQLKPAKMQHGHTQHP
jgi:hypothetical protein